MVALIVINTLKILEHLRQKIDKKLSTARRNSKFTGLYKKVHLISPVTLGYFKCANIKYFSLWLILGFQKGAQ